MEKKIGQLIRERVDAQNVNITKFAEALNTERTNVYNIFERESIDTDLLKKIGQLLNYDFFQDLLEPGTIREIILRHSFSKKVYVELNLDDDDLTTLGLEDKVVKKLL